MLEAYLLGYEDVPLHVDRQLASDSKVYVCETPTLKCDSLKFQQNFGVSHAQTQLLLDRGEFTTKQMRYISSPSHYIRYRQQHPLTTARKLRRLAMLTLAERSGVPEAHLHATEHYALPLGQSDAVMRVLKYVSEIDHPVFRRRVLLRMSIWECGIPDHTMCNIVLRMQSITPAVMDVLVRTLRSSAEDLGFRLNTCGMYAQVWYHPRNTSAWRTHAKRHGEDNVG